MEKEIDDLSNYISNKKQYIQFLYDGKVEPRAYIKEEEESFLFRAEIMLEEKMKIKDSNNLEENVQAR